MILNYFKTAVRNISRHRVHSILSITGLAVGMACTMVILFWVRYELSFDMLLSFETIYAGNEKQRESWTGDIDNFTYLLLAPNTDYRELEKKLPELVERYLDKDIQDVGGGFDLLLQPLCSIHLYSKLKGDIEYHGIIEGVVAFTAIAIVILLIACINFMNLSTARSAGRSREIGVRKSLGADRRAIVVQFMGESLILSMISMLFAQGLVELLIPLFPAIFPWEVKFEHIYTPGAIAGLIGLAVVAGVIAGSYPAFMMSAFQPIQALKGTYGKGAGRSRFRSLLVVFQFTVSITLIVATIVCFRQFVYMQNHQSGKSKPD